MFAKFRNTISKTTGKIKEIWNDWGFEIVLASIIIIILILALFRIGRKGTWSKSLYIPESTSSSPTSSKRRPPKESKGELECKRVLEDIFRKPFIKARPDFLRNPVTGGINNLELDCYNHELRLAVEYSGVQHYKYVPFFHKNKEAFLNQKYRDDMKRRLCRDNGIILIEVPYSVKIEDIKDYILKEIRRI